MSKDNQEEIIGTVCEVTTPLTLNKKLGLTEIYQHDLAENAVCKKCHRHVTDLKLKVCPVIGKEEVARFRDYEER